MSQNIIITDAGRAALINAANTGTNAATITQMGITQTAFTPSAAAVILPGEIKRVTTLAGVAVADDAIHLTVRDDSTGAYAMRGYAFYLSDGTLFAIYGQATPIVNKTAASMMLLSLDIAFADVTTHNIEFGDANFILPIATTNIYGQVKLSTLAAAQTGTDSASVLTPSTARQAILTWLLAQDGAGSGLDADLLDGQHASAFLQASLFTGAQIMSRLVTADGAGSGLDADLLDGQHASDFLQASLFTGAQMLSRLLSVDGAGSGLDADLLDGQDGSYYTNIVARLGFTPLNAANYTAADVFAKVLGLDGAGSGLDADLLDGYQASAFLQASLFTGAQIISKLGFTPLNAANYTAADVLAKALTVDGSGSGLDADLLDGRHASDFALLAGWEYGNNANGHWRKSPDGVIEQWGTFTGNFSEGAQIRNFPIAFTDLNSVMMQSNTMNTGGTVNNDIWTQSGLISLTQFRIVFQATSSGNYGSGARWYAIGK